MEKLLCVNNISYEILNLLGKGKGGYSYLAQRDNHLFVLKQIHNEPCDYYEFGNKIEAELNDYNRLLQTGIRMPKMYDIDMENQRVLKEYIDGPTIFQLVKEQKVQSNYFEQVRDMAKRAKAYGLNIDYFPTNFIVQNQLLYYIDYECNPYMEQWDFENWGVKYWSKTKEFEQYLETQNSK